MAYDASMDIISVERLRDLLHYDAETGLFTWRHARHKCTAGAVAGCPGGVAGYIQIRLDYRRYYAHRLAWLYMHGQWPLSQIDHINGEKADNRIANLRDVSVLVNHENHRAAHSNSKTGFLGASICGTTGRFVAQIKLGGKQTFLGRFDTVEEAHQVYLSAKREKQVGCTI